MAIRHSRSATRHHISHHRSSYVVRNAWTVADLGASLAWPERLLHLGPDSQGVMLEVMTVAGERGDRLIVHAMPMRRRYQSLVDPSPERSRREQREAVRQ